MCKREFLHILHTVYFVFRTQQPFFLQLYSSSIFCLHISVYLLFLTLPSLCVVYQVNGLVVQGLQHSDVVAAIKSGGDELQLLVVDPDTEAFFRSCQVIPTEEHLTGKQL